jgi:hypothetical protein
MIQRCRQLGFAPESGQRLRVAAEDIGQHLEATWRPRLVSSAW